MLAFLTGIIKNLIGKIIFFGIVAFVAINVWHWYKEKREARTFVTSFSDVEGLRKGAQVYSNGVLVGKVIRIFPLGNSGQVGVKAVITNKDFPSPKSAVSAKIVTNYESGGGKILEVQNLFTEMENEVVHALSKNTKINQDPQLARTSIRLIRNFYQLSIDWANDLVKALNSRQSKEFQEDFSHNVDTAITSFEYGTVRNDVQNSINDLNHKIKDFEKRPDKEAITQKALQTKAESLKNTIKTFDTLADVYK